MTGENKKNDVLYTIVNSRKESKAAFLDKGPVFGIRHLQSVLYFVLLFVSYGFRVSLSIAIVAMTTPNSSINPDIPKYNWTDKNIILSAFFWSYIVPQTFAGYAAHRFGAKWFLVGTMAAQSSATLLIPLAADKFGSKGLIIIRVLQGFCQAFLYPSLTELLTNWVPHQERSRLGTLTFGAVPFGTVVAMTISGLISASWYGWPLVFYLYGGLGLIWTVAFSFLGHNSPGLHPNISKEEKYYIQENTGHSGGKKVHKIPWMSIIKSLPLWGTFLAQNGHNYCFWTLLTQIPSYMYNVMGFDIKSNSLFSALPYLTFWIMSAVFGYFSDFIVNKKIFSRTVSRKVFNSIGLVVPAFALIYLGYTGSNQPTQAILLLVVAVGINSSVMCGFGVNHLDLSPNFASTLMGLSNGFSHVTALLAPLVVQFLVDDKSDPAEWRKIFLLTAGINTAAAVAFILFGSAEIQKWNEPEKEEGEGKEDQEREKLQA